MKIMYQNASAISAAKVKIERSRERLQPVLNEMNRLELPLKVTTDLFRKLFTGDPVETIKNELAAAAGEPPKWFGLSLNKRKAIDLVELPDLSVLCSLIKGCNGIEPGGYDRATDELRYLEVKGSNLVFTKEAEQNLEDVNTMYATTPTQEALIEAHKKAAAALNELQKVGNEAIPGFGIRRDDKVGDLFFVKQDGALEINDEFYRNNIGALRKQANGAE